MNNQIDTTQARVVRKATLKHVDEAFDRAAVGIRRARKPRTTPTRHVRRSIELLYRKTRKTGTAVGFVHYKSAKGGRHDIASVGSWCPEEGGLLAEFLTLRSGRPVGDGPDVTVSRHAIERTAQRLGTLDTQHIRDELAPAVISMAHSTHQGRGGWARCPHGVVRFEYSLQDKRLVVTTYIGDDHAGRKHKALEFPPIPTADGDFRIVAATPGRAPIFDCVFDTNPTNKGSTH